MRPRLVPLGLAVAWVCAGQTAAQTLGDPSLTVEAVQGGFSLPTGVGVLGVDEYLVIEKETGKVRHVADGAITGDALDLPVNIVSERGLLGIAVNTENPQRVFLYYTAAAVDEGSPIANRVSRYVWNPATRRLENPTIILELPVTNGPNHDGGVLVLGPPGQAPGVGDGALLYAVIGDLNRNGQLQNFAQGLPDDSGVILRVRQDGTAPNSFPLLPFCPNDPNVACLNNTPCGGQTCQLQVRRYFAYGVRNSFGMARDPGTGGLWNTENGPTSFDEVNRVIPGHNSGWEDIMGPDSLDPNGVSDLFVIPGARYSDPEFSWRDPVAVTSIVFPVGSSLGELYDERALVGDNNTGRLYSFPLNAARSGFDLAGDQDLADLVADPGDDLSAITLGSGFGVITDLEVGPDGHLYVLSLAAGTLYRVTGPRAVPTLSGAGGLALALLALLVPIAVALRASRPRG